MKKILLVLTLSICSSTLFGLAHLGREIDEEYKNDVNNLELLADKLYKYGATKTLPTTLGGTMEISLHPGITEEKIYTQAVQKLKQSLRELKETPSQNNLSKVVANMRDLVLTSDVGRTIIHIQHEKSRIIGEGEFRRKEILTPAQYQPEYRELRDAIGNFTKKWGIDLK